MLMKYTITSIFLAVVFQLAFAQQYPLFTNYVMNKYGYNPAINLDKEILIANLVYRRQWNGLEGGPSTQVAGIRGRLKTLPIGGGMYVFNDEAGVIKRTGGFGMFNFVKQIGQETTISAGASIGYFSLRISDGATVSDENDIVLPNARDGQQYLDFNAGFYAEHKGLFVGFAVPQIIERDFDFTKLEDRSRLLRHYHALAGVKVPVTDKFFVEPSMLVKFVDAAPLQIDGSLKVSLDKFWIAGSYRMDDAFTAMAGFAFGNFNLGYAYDFTTTDLRNYSNGSHEISLEYRFGRQKDSDGDGVPDNDDKCPDVPGPKENGGCPETAVNEAIAVVGDSDGDGVPDKDDKCPNTPGPKSNQGCPFGDRDGDGIRDDVDKCPDVPGVASNGGCPIDDRDMDGIADRLDKCPDDPGTLRSGGCPESDRDGDGIADIDDKCPNTKGIAGGDGCPVVSAAEMDVLNLAIRNLYFNTDKSDIWPESHVYLNRLADLMASKQDWKLKLTGHADSVGSSEYNISLSKRRAESVMFYLMNKGVNRKQLIVEYYGENIPFANNASEGGRQLNRRVEMEFVFQ
jgi:type IX secretion system PorP/SprF family membrane protein